MGTRKYKIKIQTNQYIYEIHNQRCSMTYPDWIWLNVNFILQLRIHEVLTKLNVLWRCLKHCTDVHIIENLILPQNILQKVVAWYTDFFSNLWQGSVLQLFSALSDFSWLQQSSGYTSHIANFTEGELTFFFLLLGHD